MVIVDTSVWVEYFGEFSGRETEWLDRRLGSEPTGLTDLILCEVLQGYRDEFTFARVRRELAKLDIFDGCGAAIAIAAARNHRTLRQKGFTVRKTIDCVIATFCIESGLALLHRDRDFDAFEKYLGLQVVHP
jgi:predicted nucleic acid-binding protein